MADSSKTAVLATAAEPLSIATTAVKAAETAPARSPTVLRPLGGESAVDLLTRDAERVRITDRDARRKLSEVAADLTGRH
ncbi:hypothetical protein [Streptomyces sp. IBSBF 3136]|uniref:hypothetical protein n=1 Tax=Streptomyces sp. IBSBF 3136 TaxID=2903524 RepID=UPI002FDC0763